MRATVVRDVTRGAATVLATAVAVIVVAAPLPGWSGRLAGGTRGDAPLVDPTWGGVPVPAEVASATRAPIGTHPALLADQPVAAAPVGISLPTLLVAALVQPVGVGRGGELAVPPSASVAAWYRGGPTPSSAVGSSVIAAHVDHDGERGVFFRLADLRPGDPVAVTSADGTARSFEVVSTTSYDKADLPTGELFRRTGDPVLTLITCGGEFRAERRSYADNVVVRAVPVAG